MTGAVSGAGAPQPHQIPGAGHVSWTTMQGEGNAAPGSTGVGRHGRPDRPVAYSQTVARTDTGEDHNAFGEQRPDLDPAQLAPLAEQAAHNHRGNAAALDQPAGFDEVRASSATGDGHVYAEGAFPGGVPRPEPDVARPASATGSVPQPVPGGGEQILLPAHAGQPAPADHEAEPVADAAQPDAGEPVVKAADEEPAHQADGTATPGTPEGTPEPARRADDHGGTGTTEAPPEPARAADDTGGHPPPADATGPGGPPPPFGPGGPGGPFGPGGPGGPFGPGGPNPFAGGIPGMDGGHNQASATIDAMQRQAAMRMAFSQAMANIQGIENMANMVFSTITSSYQSMQRAAQEAAQKGEYR